MEAGIAIFVLVLAGYALVANRLDHLSIGPAIAFVVAGFVLGPDGIGLLDVGLETETVRLLAEITLAFVLFTDASTVDVSGLRRDAGLIGRLLAIGLPLTIFAGGLIATLVFPELPLATALLIGAILAPTDAALGMAVVSNPAVPIRIRRVLNVESGLNDGIATPFVVLFIALATAGGELGGGHLEEAIRESVIAVAAGIAVGGIGGFLLKAADERELSSALSRQIAVFALALGSYLVSLALGGNGFIAAFVAGITFGRVISDEQRDDERFSEAAGILLSIGVWAIFGATFVGSILSNVDDFRPLLYAVISLTVVRMLPVALGLIGSRLALPTVLFVGWFGPRGLASIVFGILAVDALVPVDGAWEVVSSTVTWTVLLSVILHGLTAGPLARRYGAWIDAHRDTGGGPLPELEDRAEARPNARSSWTRRDDPSQVSVPTRGR